MVLRAIGVEIAMKLSSAENTGSNPPPSPLPVSSARLLSPLSGWKVLRENRDVSLLA